MLTIPTLLLSAFEAVHPMQLSIEKLNCPSLGLSSTATKYSVPFNICMVLVAINVVVSEDLFTVILNELEVNVAI